MRSDQSPSRSAHVATAATTLVAMVAMAASASAMPLPRVVAVDDRSVAAEHQPVRHVAAVVVALARDVFGSDHVEALLPALIEEERFDWLDPISVTAPQSNLPPGVSPLPERLIDLPPPAC